MYENEPVIVCRDIDVSDVTLVMLDHPNKGMLARITDCIIDHGIEVTQIAPVTDIHTGNEV